MERHDYEMFERNLFPRTGGKVAATVKYEDIAKVKAEKMASVTEEFLDKLTEILGEDA